MKTKFLAKFHDRAAHFDADIELVDVISTATKKGRLNDPDKIFEFVDERKHPRLSRRSASKGSRDLAIAHLRKTVYVSFIKEMYEDTMLYFSDLLRGAAKTGVSTDRFVGEHKLQFTANDILEARSYESLIDIVSASIFRSLENKRNTTKLIEAIDSKLNLNVNPGIREAALPYLEMRHLLVHADGVADADFCTRFPLMGAQEGKKLSMSHRVISQARTCVVDMIAEYDSRAIEAGVVPNDDIAHSASAA